MIVKSDYVSKTFRPIKFEITVENLGDLVSLWAAANCSRQVLQDNAKQLDPAFRVDEEMIRILSVLYHEVNNVLMKVLPE